MSNKKNKTDQQWREQLSKEQYHISREKGTEAPFSGAYWDQFSDGVYRCVCCHNVLFESQTKFDAGCGWPSFYDALPDSVIFEEDTSLPGPPRIEVLCKKCHGHLGHVFSDGPQPTGQRFCINSAVIDFKSHE